MKINIVFIQPPYPVMETHLSPDESFVLIKDPYNVKEIDDEPRGFPEEGESITYEEYCLELQALIDNTICSAKLATIGSCDAITIKGCREGPNFAVLHRALVNAQISLASTCRLTYEECSFGGPSYVDAVIEFVRSTRTLTQTPFFFINLDQPGTTLSEHDQAKLACLYHVAFFPSATSAAVLRRFADDQLQGIPTAPLLAQFASVTYRIMPLSSYARLQNFFSQAHQQRRGYTCGPAALKMIADYYVLMGKRTLTCGEPVSDYSVWEKLNSTTELKLSKSVKTTAAEGCEIADMCEGLMEFKLSVIDDREGLSPNKYDRDILREHKETRWDKIREIVNLSIPVVINLRDKVEDGHYEVAIGLDDNNIMLANPGAALFGKIKPDLIPREEFISRWTNMDRNRHGRFLIIPPNAASVKAVESILKEVPHSFNGEPVNFCV